MKIEKSKIQDIDTLMGIYAGAQSFMKRNGNPDQWGDTWPSREKIIEDINEEISYCVIENGKIIAVFAFVIGEDKTYLDIREGAWHSNNLYGTIHRLASSFTHKGVFHFIMGFLWSFGVDIRIDTHKNNKPMLKAIEKEGFIYCGHITPIEGGDRLAFDKAR